MSLTLTHRNFALIMDVGQLHSNSLGADNLPTGGMNSLANEQEVVRRAGRQAISAFLDCHNCFSVIRSSGKVVVFDTQIPIQLAFYALVEHGAYNYYSSYSSLARKNSRKLQLQCWIRRDLAPAL
jgi:hypothetical protein